jgi:hypothetical protein
MQGDKPMQGGKAVVVNTTGADTIKHISKDGYVGLDTFNYTTADGTADVTVEVTPGSCAGSKCGVLGSCQAGACRCAAGSGLLPVYVANPNATARAVTPNCAACRYPGEQQALI